MKNRKHLEYSYENIMPYEEYHKVRMDNKWDNKEGHSHKVDYDVFYKGWEAAIIFIEQKIREVADELEVPTYKVGIGANNEEQKNGFNEGQKSASRQIKKLIWKK